MHIGITYDLRDDYLAEGYSDQETAEFDRLDTIEAIEAALDELGYQTDRIGNVRRLIERLARGDRWDMVFNIAEGLHGLSRESQVPSILDVYGIPYTFSDPLILSLSLHKGLTKMLMRQAGIATPDFALAEYPKDARNIDLPFPLFVKPVAEGTSKGVSGKSIVRDRPALEKACAELLFQFQQPVLVETYLSGREFTVGLVGSGQAAEVLGTMEIHLLPDAEEGVYSYTNKERCEELVRYRLALREEDPLIEQVEQLALSSWRALGGRDGGRVDIRCDDLGRPQFIEVNPLAGLHPHHSDLPILCGFLGVAYVDLIDRIVSSARHRMTSACDLQQRA